MRGTNDVWALLRAEITRRECVHVALDDALGCTLREDVTAPEDQPPFDRSAVDGFAVLCGDGAAEFVLSGEIRAGEPRTLVLQRGHALRIATGAPVPRGADVVMLEDADVRGGAVSFRERGRDHVRRRGEDVRAGDVVISAGRLLGEGAIALLASLGCVRPLVTRRITAHHVATGNEIVAPDVMPGPGKIRDANSPLIRAWAAGHGMVFSQQRVAEDAPALRAALRDDCDLLLVSGGASVGPHDFTEQVLRDAGFEILVTKVSVRPGRPLIVARRGEQWAFGLPGNPLSHFVCLHVFVEAAFAAMNGSVDAPPLFEGRVASQISGNPRETWWPTTEGRGGLKPLRWASSGDLTALAFAGVLVRVPVSGLAEGAKAEFIRIR